MPRPVHPGPVVIPLTAEIRIVWGILTIEWANVIHARYSTPPTFDQALANSIFTTVSNALTTSGWGVQLGSDVELRRVEVKNIATANLVWSISNSAPVGGAGLQTSLPVSMAVEVTARTQFSGRGFVGRHYTGGVAAGAQASANQFEQTAGDAAVAFWEAIRNGLPSHQLTMALGQRQLDAGTDANGNPMPPRTANSEPIIRHDLTDLRFDTQRRRLGR